MRMRKALLLFIGLLVLVSLACEQSGEILSPEEATARAQEGVFQRSDDRETTAGAEFVPGGVAHIAGSGFLVNLLDAPGGRIAGSQANGSTVEILESAEFEGEVWYHVDSETGQGWLRAENLEAIEGEGEAEGETTASGPVEGESVYLVATGFLVNLLAEPNGNIIAVQERGVEVRIISIFEADDGSLWYLIDAPTGEGWVPAENISQEPLE